MTIGDRIRKRREELNLSQDDLAKRLGYKSRSSINKIENKASNLPQTKIVAISQALNTTPAYIMGWHTPSNIYECPISKAGNKMNELQIFKKEELNKVNEACKQTPEYQGYFYIVEYGDFVKIGASKNPYVRYKQLLRNAECYGNVPLGRIAISRSHTNYYQNEALIHELFADRRKLNTELYNTRFEEVINEIPDDLQYLDFVNVDPEAEAKQEYLFSAIKQRLMPKIDPIDYVIREEEFIKFDYIDRILACNFPVSIYEIAEDYGLHHEDFLAILCDLGVYDTCGENYLVSDDFEVGKEIAVFPTIRTHISGAKTVGYSERWTQKGWLALYERLKKEGVLPVIEQKTTRERL